jgi:diguanylate cyclase (GGDEF)-like protein
LFILLLYWLVRSNRLREKSNQQLTELNSKLYIMATTDHLSQLSNRRHFLEMAQKKLLYSKRKSMSVATLMIDIDHFKSVNDRYGHHTGDLVIQYVAKKIKAALREYDLVGRLGGEEFAMMLMDCDLSAAEDIAKRLCVQVSTEHVTEQEFDLEVTISIGIGILSENDIHIEQTLKRADEALYKAKSAGRNRVEVV